jgi:hypothetical protein
MHGNNLMKNKVTQDLRTRAVSNALKNYEELDGKQRLTIPFQNRKIHIEVLKIDPNYLLLNHENNRVGAQLADNEEMRTVYQDPTCQEAQEIIADLLRATDEFPALKQQLKDSGQQEPGLITREGVLLNGNTRAVALRDLGETVMEIGLLPSNVSSADFLDIEISLQMVDLVKQKYSFANELLVIEKYRNIHRNDKMLAERMGWKRGWQKKIDERVQLLNLIRYIRDLGTKPIKYQEFDGKETHLTDLLQIYNANKDHPKIAEKIKSSRIVSILLGLNKDQTRAIDEDFFENYVIPQLEGKKETLDLLSHFKKVPTDNDELDDLLDDKGIEEVLDIQALLTNILSRTTGDDGSLKRDLPTDLDDLRLAIRRGADKKILEMKDEAEGTLPGQILVDIADKFEKLNNIIESSAMNDNFDIKKFKYNLIRIEKTYEKLKRKPFLK